MSDRDLLILTGEDVAAAVEGREREIIESVARAYLVHAAGDTSLPNSVFLRFPGDALNRIIALPAYLGGEFDAAGVKWVSSFPGNLARGLDRASAAIILNSVETGRPQVFMEGSLVSAKRTAAGAALAARTLHTSGPVETLGLLGCGPINFEVVRFMRAVAPSLRRLLLFDVDAGRARQFAEKCRALGDFEAHPQAEARDALGGADVVSLATTALKPHLFDLSACAPGTTVLHVSLRDLAPEVILSCDNVVDDVEHVCRAQTSVHLAEQLVGHRDFIRGTLAEVLNGTARPADGGARVTVFSPFGLGVLDIAVAGLVREAAVEAGRGSVVPSFFPDSYAGGRDGAKA